jgi:4-hydroxy-2-oxoheptanedioate aldolase
MEKLLLAARATQIAALVRVRGTIEPDIRKALELGATGVIIPQVHSGEQMRAIIRAAKFPPLGRRGGDSSVSSASFGGQGFDWAKYATDANRNSLIIPMAESFEFFDNIDDILMVEGIDVVHFGPADYSLSRGIPVDYSMRHPEVQERLLFLIDKCHAKGIKVMVPCAPAEESSARQLIEMGCDMLIVGNDVHFLNAGCRSAAEVAKSAI